MFFHQFGEGAQRGAPVCENTAFYETLKIEKGASDADVKKAYRQLAMKHHPDKGGDSEKFKEVTKAYETLSDPVSRSKYDAGGGEQGGGDIFSSMFGAKQRKVTQDAVQILKVTLEDIYRGCTKKFEIKRKILNRAKGAVKPCTQCQGRGMCVQVLRVGPMVQQIQTQCAACGGLGKTCDFSEEKRMLEVYVPRGAPDGHRIVFRGMTDEHPDADPGDVVFLVRQLPHASFVRKTHDLYVQKRIGLVEALCGFQIELSHLDGRSLFVKSPVGKTLHLAEKVDPANPLPMWEVFEDFDCTLPNAAEAETDNIDALKKACETQLKAKGVESEAFVLVGKKAYFKQRTAQEAIAAKTPSRGKTLHVRMPAAPCMMYAIRGEGMPVFSNPLLKGNFFVELTLDLSVEVSDDAKEKLRELLPAPLNGPSTSVSEDCEAILIDCVASHAAYKSMQPEDDSANNTQQCRQQ
jgi:DnaJ family protein A protein 2